MLQHICNFIGYKHKIVKTNKIQFVINMKVTHIGNINQVVQISLCRRLKEITLVENTYIRAFRAAIFIKHKKFSP